MRHVRVAGRSKAGRKPAANRSANRFELSRHVEIARPVCGRSETRSATRSATWIYQWNSAQSRSQTGSSYLDNLGRNTFSLDSVMKFDSSTLTGTVPVDTASLKQPVYVQVFTQFLTVTTQHRLVLDWRQRYFVVSVVFFQWFVLYHHSLLTTIAVCY